jgi:hypothetical protein
MTLSLVIILIQVQGHFLNLGKLNRFTLRVSKPCEHRFCDTIFDHHLSTQYIKDLFKCLKV